MTHYVEISVFMEGSKSMLDNLLTNGRIERETSVGSRLIYGINKHGLGKKVWLPKFMLQKTITYKNRTVYIIQRRFLDMLELKSIINH